MESVRVIVKFRGGETADTAMWRVEAQTAALEGKDHTFAFDSVLRADSTQEDLYAAARPLVESFLDGFNATIFAYGQSGSGKTYSMLGPEEVTEALVNRMDASLSPLSGVIPRATFHIFDLAARGRDSTQYTIKCSYIEVYNESINDLLCQPPAEGLRIREFPNLGMCVIGMTEKFVSTPEEIFECLALGTANRITCATGQNSRSSRSHTVFTLEIEQKLLDGSSKLSKLNLVDLAGSEKLSKTGATGQALKEAQKINLSLTTLGRCIKALTARKEEHVPFRESKLTQILKESLGGNARTALVCTVSLRAAHKDESYQTLKFAERAKRIKNKAKSNVIRSAEELQALVNQLTEEVAALRGSGGIDAGEHVALMQLKLQYASLQETSQREMDVLRTRLEQLEKRQDLQAVNAEVQGYLQQLQDSVTRAEALSISLQQARAQLEALTALELNREAAARTVTARLNKAQLTTQQSLVDLETQVNQLTAESATAKHLATTYEDMAKALRDENSRLAAENEKLRTQGKQVGAAEEPAVTKRLRQELLEAKGQLAHANSELNARCAVQKQFFDPKVSETAQVIATLHKSLAAEKDANTSLRKVLRTYELEIDRLKSVPAGQSEEQQALATARLQVRTLSQRLEDETAALRSSLQRANEELASARRQVEAARDTKRSEVEVATLQAEINQLQRALAKEMEVRETKRTLAIVKPVRVVQSEAPKAVKFGEWKLKKTESKFLQQAIEEAKRAEQQAPTTAFKVQYAAAAIKSLYAGEEEVPTRVTDESDWESSDEDVVT